MPALDHTFPDRSSILFGREKDIAFLLERTERPGVTVVLAPPQMGKSWLLTEVARQLSVMPVTGGALTLRGLPPLVGRVESEGEYADMLPRAVQDLYTRWLSNATYREQAQTFFEQQKPDLFGRIGQAVGTLVKAVAPLHGPPGTAIGTLVKSSFDRLADANRDLKSGGISLPTLQTADSRELLQIVFTVTAQPSVLVFDQWEKSPDLDKEAAILDTFLRHTEDWSPCHILVGSRPETKPRAQTRKLRGTYPGVVETYLLKPMALDDPDVVGPLLASLRERVPATRNVQDGTLLELIAGYPRVLSQWTSPYNARQLQTLEDLKRVAEEANTFRYPEFEDLLPQLSDDQRAVAIRLALLPSCANAGDWSALESIVRNGCPAGSLDGLFRSQVLESTPPPSYGHAKRAEAAMQWFSLNCWYETREIGDSLAVALAHQLPDLDASRLPFVSAMSELRKVSPALKLSQLSMALCEAAFSLLLQPGVEGSVMKHAAALLEDSKAAPLLAIGLFNALLYAKQEEKLELRDQLLREVRELAARYPEAAVREQLAKGLFNALVYAQQEGKPELRDNLLEELRELTGRYPDDAAVRERLAIGLNNALFYAQQEGKPELRDNLLEELRELAARYPDDAPVREWLAKGLHKALNGALQEGKPELRANLLAELRELAGRYPDDAAVREWLAKGLYNALLYAQQQGKPELRANLLAELRELAGRYPDDAAVREWLAKGLYNALLYAQQEGKPELRDNLLAELRKLAGRYPDDAAVREWLAKGLYNALLYAQQEGKPELRDNLLAELRELAERYPEAAVREQLAGGLNNALVYARQEAKLELRDQLLVELRELAARYPEAAVREQLAKGLFNALNDARQEEKLELRDQLLGELRELAARYPEAAVREQLARGLYNALNYAKQEGKLELRDQLLGELRELLQQYPDDTFLRDEIAPRIAQLDTEE